MRHYTDSDLFDIINRGNSFQNRLQANIRNINPSIILNSKAKPSLENLKKLYKETITIKVVDAINKNQIILICPDVDHRFDEFFPFCKVKLSGKECVVVDVSRYTEIERDANDKPTGYKIDVRKLYSLIIPAFISLKLYGKGITLPSETTKYLANIWARMFCNVLMSNAIGVLQNHTERYRAFMYFSMKFFMVYYLNTPTAIVDKIADTYIEEKNDYINFVETNLKNKEINLYESFNGFCRTLFNNEITNIKGMTSKISDMNQSQFITIFRNQYSMNAIMSLCSVDYFTFSIFAAFNKANIVRDRGFEVIIDGRKGEYKRDVPKLLESLYKEL